MLLVIAWALSSDRRHPPWRASSTALALALCLAAAVLLSSPLLDALVVLHHGMLELWRSLGLGVKFLLGRFGEAPDSVGKALHRVPMLILFQVLPRLVIFGALAALLERYGAISAVVRRLHGPASRLGLTGAESAAALCSLVLGVESLLLLRAYLPRMSRSELCTVVATGMSSLGANFFVAATVNMRGDYPGLLAGASLVALPASIAVSKLLLPPEAPIDSAPPETTGIDREEGATSCLFAGAWRGLRMIGGAAAMVVVVMGLFGLADLLVVAAGDLAGRISGSSCEWTLPKLLEHAGYPLALLIGTPPSEAAAIGEVLSTKIASTETNALKRLILAFRDGELSGTRSALVGIFALGGSANLLSLGAFFGGAATLAPDRIRELTGVCGRALLAAFMAGLIVACTAGIAPDEIGRALLEASKK
ncbi:MAG: nucleoside transporter C-terminal domain-containing protein [Polyangia bacterium]